MRAFTNALRSSNWSAKPPWVNARKQTLSSLPFGLVAEPLFHKTVFETARGPRVTGFGSVFVSRQHGQRSVLM